MLTMKRLLIFFKYNIDYINTNKSQNWKSHRGLNGMMSIHYYASWKLVGDTVHCTRGLFLSDHHYLDHASITSELLAYIYSKW